MIWVRIKEWIGCLALDLMIGLGGLFEMSVHETSSYICKECNTIPFKGSHCMCHGLYVTYEGHPYSSEGVRYESTKDDDSKESDSGKEMET